MADSQPFSSFLASRHLDKGGKPLSLSLPVGVRLVGRKWQEIALLNTAEQLAAQTAGNQKPLVQDMQIYESPVRV